MLDALAKGVLEATKKDFKKKSRVDGKSQEGWSWTMVMWSYISSRLIHASITISKNFGATERFYSGCNDPS
jgi:hypothetical protein